MHIEFDPHKINWNLFIANQASNFLTSDDEINTTTQFGGSVTGPNAHYGAFSGMPYQRGAGIGSVFRSLWRFLIPLGREAGREIGKQGLVSGVRALSSVLDGEKNLKTALAEEGKAGLKNLLDKASLNLDKRRHDDQHGSGFDFKRYKKSTGGAISINNHTTPSTVGLFTANDSSSSTSQASPLPIKSISKKNNNTPKKHINNAGKKGNKHIKYQSLIGPSSISNFYKSISKTNKKRLRVDALGPY